MKLATGLKFTNGYCYIKGSGHRIRLPKLDKNLALILGILWGDGWLVSRKVAKRNFSWRIGMVGCDLQLINCYTSLIHKVFSIKPRLHDRKTKVEAYFNSRVIYELLNRTYGFPDGEKIGRLKMPQSVMDSEELIPPFLSGAFSTDGTFVIDKNYPRIGVNSATLKFIVDIEKSLHKLGFNPRISVWNRKIGNPLYGVYLNGHRQANLFYQKIGFIGEKANKLTHFLNYCPASTAPSRDDKSRGI